MKDSDLIVSNSAFDTNKAGEELAKSLSLGDIVLFSGELGAGKTEFIRGVCQYFKTEEQVNSPTFTITNNYNAIVRNNEIQLVHIDLYRIKRIEEITDIGLHEILYDEYSIKLIEWADKFDGIFPQNCIRVNLIHDENDQKKRFIKIKRN